MRRVKLLAAGGMIVRFLGCDVQAETEGQGVSNLTLSECVQRALEDNLGIHSAKVDQDIAHWTVRREWAAFEPRLSMAARRERNARENSVEQSRSQISPLFEEENEVYDGALEGLFFSGARYQLGYSLSDLANNLTNLTFQSPFESQYQSFGGASVTQPLLRGAGLTASLAALRIAATQSEIAFQQLRSQMMKVVAQTEAAYWDLALAQQLEKIRDESVRISRDILEDNQERVRTGKMSALEVEQARSGVAERLIRKQEARRQSIAAVSRLRTLFSENVRDGGGLIRAVDRPAVEDPAWDFDRGMQAATEFQPDYLRARYTLDQEDIRLQYAQRQRWPQIDLVASYGFNGLGASAGDSWDDVKSGDFESWSVGAQLTVGLGGDSRAKSEWAVARLRKKRALFEIKHIETEVANSLDAGLTQLEILRKSLDSYGVVADFNQQLLDVELKRLHAGKSDSRRVLEIEEELFAAKTAQGLSRNNYQKTLVQLRLAMGTSLMERGLDIMEVATENGAEHRALSREEGTGDGLTEPVPLRRANESP